MLVDDEYLALRLLETFLKKVSELELLATTKSPVFFDDILFVEGLKEYVKIVCKKERIVTFERLKNLEAALPTKQFLRVHKSSFVFSHSMLN